MKRPAFQFYPADWLRDTALRSCSTGARGLWIDMICYMHEGNPYGHLRVGEKIILSKNLARMVGEDVETVNSWLEEMFEAKVFDVLDDGTIYSRRMVRDENIRRVRAECGKLGGEKNIANTRMLKQNLKQNEGKNDGDEEENLLKQNVKQKTPPSSSSSSSTSYKDIVRFADFWSVWPQSPRKVGKAACLKRWDAMALDSLADQIIAHVNSIKTTKQWTDGYEPAPLTYLNQRRWEDDVAKPAERRAI